MKKRLGILGVGSAGLVSASGFCANLSNEWEVVSIYNPDIPSLGIGESTNANFVQILEYGVDFEVTRDLDQLDGTLKFGTKYVNWRDTEWLNPLIEGAVAVHFNTNKLKEFVLPRLKQHWGNKFTTIEGNVDDVFQDSEKVSVTIDGKIETFDYLIDCRGFPTDYSDYVLSKCSLVNHCVVYDQDTFDPGEYTEHIAMENGWMFGIPLTSRKSYGYLYNDTFSTKNDVLQDMSKYLNIPAEELDVREYQFKPYYAYNILDGRILKNGNRAVFFEPMSATSIYAYVRACTLFYDFLVGKANQLQVNGEFRDCVEEIEILIEYMYHGGSNYDTEFWNKSKENAIDNLRKSYRWYKHYCTMKEMHNLGDPYNYIGLTFGALSWVKMDRFFGYGYLKDKEFNFDMEAVKADKQYLTDRDQMEIQKNSEIAPVSPTSEEFKNKGYAHIRGVINQELVELVTEYALNDHIQNYDPKTSGDGQIPGTHSKYADPLMEALLLKLHPTMEATTGLKLYPTYSYYRVYKSGDELVPHKDRYACEVSTTVCFNFDYRELNGIYDWPIFMDGSKCVMAPGDIVIYRGCDLAHWREKFMVPEGSYHVQAFLHYVDANGPHADQRLDKRPYIGYRVPGDAIPYVNAQSKMIESSSNKSYITYIK